MSTYPFGPLGDIGTAEGNPPRKRSSLITVGQRWRAGPLWRKVTRVYSVDPVRVDYIDGRGNARCCAYSVFQRWVRDNDAKLEGAGE